jgi:hypothetical protein
MEIFKNDKTWIKKVDSAGRITQLQKPFPDHPIGGHSVCCACGKDLSNCWDTVCSRCQRTFCYDHSVAIKGLWVCEECAA